MTKDSPMQVGDEIVYKRKGTRGMYRCRILAINHEAFRPYTLEILAHHWTGKPSHAVGQKIHVTGKGIRRL